MPKQAQSYLVNHVILFLGLPPPLLPHHNPPPSHNPNLMWPILFLTIIYMFVLHEEFSFMKDFEDFLLNQRIQHT